VTPGQIGAHRVVSTGPGGPALVNIDAAGGNVLWVVRPAVLADTVGVLLLGLAVGMLAAGDSLAWLGARGGGGTAHEGGRAGAGVGAKGVPTHSVGAADSRGAATLVNVETECASSKETRTTETFPNLTHGVVGAVEVGLTESSHFRRLAGSVRVAAESRGALAQEAGVGVPAHSVGAADIGLGRAFVHVGAGSEGVPSQALFAGALVAALRVDANSIVTTGIAETLVHV
jgi:hypothetical protein